MNKLHEKKVLAIIPARGGSKGIPQKNIRFMAGKPLIAYSIATAQNSIYNIDVVVSTDDEQIERIATAYGAQVIKRPNELALDNVTLDPVIYYTLNSIEQQKNIKYDVVVTLQPTSPLLKSHTLDRALQYYFSNDFDTVLSCVNKPHLAWGEREGKVVPLYKERLNRQCLPKHLCETGAFFISSRKCVLRDTRIGKNVSIYEVNGEESVDIDTPHDWWIAEKELLKKNILIRIEGYKDIGTGHIHRGLLLAYNLIDHNVVFVVSEKSDIAIDKIRESFFPYRIIKDNSQMYELINELSCDILINDMLNTDEEYITYCKKMGVKVVNFEDLGTGARFADVVINDLYEKQNDLPNFYWGSDYYCIRDEFLLAEPGNFKNNVHEILVSFGGTDPSNLTRKVLECVPKIQRDYNIHFTFILGMGYKHNQELLALSQGLDVSILQNVLHMSDYMGKADMAICSQGRTMLELARMAVPTILLAENEREQNHEFGYMKNGFINLGVGDNVNEDTLIKTIEWLVSCPQLRNQIRNQMLKIDLISGTKRVKELILYQKEI